MSDTDELKKQIEVARLKAELRELENTSQNKTVVGDVLDDTVGKVTSAIKPVNIIAWGIINLSLDELHRYPELQFFL